MKNKIESQLLVIDFDCDPDEITKSLGMTPTQVIMKGDVRHKDPTGVHPPTLHKQNVWVLQLDLPVALDLDAYLNLALEKLELNGTAIAQLAAKYNIELSIYGFARDADRIAIHLSKEQSESLAKLKISLDVDIYPTEG